MKNLTLQKIEHWSIDQAHSRIEFKIRHRMIAHIRGTFRKYDALISITNDDITTASIDCRIDVDSIDTGDPERDQELRGPDYFDTARYPRMKFAARSIGKQNERGMHPLKGILTIKEIARPVELDLTYGGMMKDKDGTERSGFQIDGSLNRMDWGHLFRSPLSNNGILTGETVVISCEIELVKPSNILIEAVWSHNGNSDKIF